jgi:hypothetical protein
MSVKPTHSKFVVALALAVLFGLSGPGIVAAHAEPDLAPSASELFGGAENGARKVAVPTGSSCSPAVAEAAMEQRKLMAARLAELMMRDDGDGPGRALQNGYGYKVARNPLAQLEQIQREAARRPRTSR